MNEETPDYNGPPSIPSSQETLCMDLPQNTLAQLVDDLINSGHISSDGEMSEIARKECTGNGYDLDTVQEFVLKKEQSRSPFMIQGYPIKSDAHLVTQANVQYVDTEKYVDAGHLQHANHLIGMAGETSYSNGVSMNPPQTESTVEYKHRSPATGTNPSVTNYPGELNFDIKINKASKSKDAQYSDKLGKLFINQNRHVMVRFRVGPSEMPVPFRDMYIRAVVIYLRPDDYPHPVKVCYTHSRNSMGHMKSPNAEHLLRCADPESIYEVDTFSNRHSVRTRFPLLQPGCEDAGLTFKFMDLGSCSGGINRRETAVIFTLEFGEAVIGRRILPVRICTCPKRDMEQEEKNADKSQLKDIDVLTAMEPGEGKVLMEDKDVYWVPVRGKEQFEAMKNIALTMEKMNPKGNVGAWNEMVARQNKSGSTPCKRKRTT